MAIKREKKEKKVKPKKRAVQRIRIESKETAALMMSELNQLIKSRSIIINKNTLKILKKKVPHGTNFLTLKRTNTRVPKLFEELVADERRTRFSILKEVRTAYINLKDIAIIANKPELFFRDIERKDAQDLNELYYLYCLIRYAKIDLSTIEKMLITLFEKVERTYRPPRRPRIYK